MKRGLDLPKRKEKPHREYTKHQISRWQKESRRQRITLIIGLVIILGALVTVGAGWYLNNYQPMHQTVVKVNDAGYNMSYYLDILTYYAKSQPTYLSYYIDLVVQGIQQYELQKQAAAKLGITVSQKDVDAAIKDAEAEPGNETRLIFGSQLLSQKLISDYFDAQVPASAEQRQLNAMFLESITQVNQVKARLTNGEAFTDIAAELSLDSVTKNNKGAFDWMPRDVLSINTGNTILTDAAFSAEVGILTETQDTEQTKSVGYWLIKVVDRKDDLSQAQVHAILLGSEEEALATKARIDAGEDFDTVGIETTELTSTSGENAADLGWISQGTHVEAFENFVFNAETPLNTVSNPVYDNTSSTKGGYWLIQVTASEEKTIEGTNRDTLNAKLLDDWTTALWDDTSYKVENLMTDKMKAYATDKVSKRITTTT
jgi:parvulin-like peptidyl-prolyl isomerase